MNKRIDELFGQALDRAVPETWTALGFEQLSKIKEQFAELLIHECANQCYTPDGDRILRHFGITPPG